MKHLSMLIFALCAGGASADDMSAASDVSDLPPWEYQPTEGRVENGIIRVGSENCQMPVGDVPCQLFIEPMTTEDLSLARLTIEGLDSRNELIDLEKIVEETGFVPSFVWFK